MSRRASFQSFIISQYAGILPSSQRSLRARSLLALALIALLASSPALAKDPPPNLTALDAYIAKPDSSYAWNVVSTTQGDGFTTYVVDLKSQTWRDPKEVDRTLWEHWLTIVKPDGVQNKTALLWIAGGKNGDDAPQSPNADIVRMAVASKTVVAELKQIPNQPLMFFQDGKQRKEDDLIAYTWVKFMKTSDPTWTARMPMVKSAVRAMDTIQAVLATPEAGKTKIDRFVVTGGSKRGWTTWLTGAVDKRVVAIIPIVIDVLNVRASMQHHHDAYGFWAPSVGDYVHHNVMAMNDSQEYIDLLKVEDPYSYIDRLTMPKYVVNAAGDQFFLPDSSKFYFDKLKGEKYLRYVPNANHSLDGSDARQSILTFYEAVADNKPRPKFDWKFAEDGSIHVTTVDKPKEVKLWQATNPKARDFRLESLGPKYESSTLEPAADGTYTARIEKPAEGWTAFFVELTFESGYAFPFKFTTAVRVTPDVLPHKGKPLVDPPKN